jgi:hypothetical protein
MKIHLLGAKLLEKIKLELSSEEVSFVYTSHSREQIRYFSLVFYWPKMKFIEWKEGNRKETLTMDLKVVGL